MENIIVPKTGKVHYGWRVVAVGCLCIFACLGLGRFALGMLLPAMGTALQLSYSQMGFIGTANFIGYLGAVLLCSRLSKCYGPRRLITAALLVVSFSMLLISGTTNFYLLCGLYVLTGIGSALANVSIMALIPVWFAGNKRGQALGFVVIGSGLAIIISGKLVPYLNAISANGWRISWLVLGLLVLLAAVICGMIIRNHPRDLGLQAVGEEGRPFTISTTSITTKTPVKPAVLYHFAAIYFLFGFTYVIYATFIVTTLVQERGMSEAIAGNFWAWVGFLSLFSGPVFGSISDKFGRRKALMTVFMIQALAYIFITFERPDIFLYLSIGCYGIVAWSIPSIMAALVGDYVGPDRAVAVFAFITFSFGIGQVLGPFIAGLLAEMTGSFNASYLLASIFALVALVLSALLPGQEQDCVE